MDPLETKCVHPSYFVPSHVVKKQSVVQMTAILHQLKRGIPDILPPFNDGGFKQFGTTTNTMDVSETSRNKSNSSIAWVGTLPAETRNTATCFDQTGRPPFFPFHKCCALVFMNAKASMSFFKLRKTQRFSYNLTH